ncbi:MAG: RsmB/NOP family class I SAM-dependent RNA methyltransferase [Actinobacteria bacterium]|nr:RsmB/NOP family class I SAM-dependent RNA methyltransferase [Actinomycetota bacterium]
MVCRNRISKKDLLRILQKNFKCPGENIFSMDRSVNKAKLFENCIFIKNLQGLYDLDAFRDGYFSIQDFTSQIPVKFFLNPQKGERILDLCGAPGGKAALMSEATSGSCEIISIDISTERLNLFKENIRRLGLKNIFLLKADAGRNGYLDDYMKNNKKTGSFIDYFDKVFVDAPCSSFGTISKNPDVKYNRDFNDLRSYSERSLKIISSSARYVKPGGIIVFYTCTLSSIENQDMIRKFAGRNSLNLRLRNVSAPRIMKKYLEEKKVNLPNCSNDYFEVLPYFFNSEAGFMAVLEKKIH